METLKLDKTRAHQTYKLEDGTVVPGVTTILGMLPKPALIHWSWQCGMDGIDYRKARDKAADIGTIVHFLIVCHMKGAKADLSDFADSDIKKAETCFRSFLEWWNTQHGEVAHSECQLVSEYHGIGGTFDLLFRRSDDTYHLYDFKSSKAIYEPEHPCQLSAYRTLAQEKFLCNIETCSIVRIDKEGNGFNPDSDLRTWRNLDQHWELFTHLIHTYHLNKKLSRRG